MGLLSLMVKLHKAQMKDVEEMQQIYDAATEIGAEEACSRVVGGSFSLSADVKEGVETHATVHGSVHYGGCSFCRYR